MSVFKVFFMVTILLSSLFAQEEDKTMTITNIQSKMDSLKKVRAVLERKIEQIDSSLKVLNISKAENEAEQLKMKGLVLKTKAAFGTDLPKLRPSPDIDVPEIKLIPAGTRIRGLDYSDDGYWRVYYDGTIGFLLDSYIVSNAEVERFKEAAGLQRDKRQKKIESVKVWVKVLTANVRREPTTTAEITNSLERGEILFVQESHESWLKVMFSNNPDNEAKKYQSLADLENSYSQGWIHESLVTKKKVRKASLEEKNRQAFIKSRQAFVGKNKHLAQRFKNAILNGQILLGMSQGMVIASWGHPDDINKSVGSYGVHEQWIYSYYSTDRYLLYFENDVLTSWQER